MSVPFYSTFDYPFVQSPGTIVNVMEYGAVGDGVTDDSAAILAAAAAAAGKSYATLFFPIGTYYYNSATAITIASNMSLMTAYPCGIVGGTSTTDCFVISSFVPAGNTPGLLWNRHAWFPNITNFTSGSGIRVVGGTLIGHVPFIGNCFDGLTFDGSSSDSGNEWHVDYIQSCGRSAVRYYAPSNSASIQDGVVRGTFFNANLIGVLHDYPFSNTQSGISNNAIYVDSIDGYIGTPTGALVGSYTSNASAQTVQVNNLGTVPIIAGAPLTIDSGANAETIYVIGPVTPSIPAAANATFSFKAILTKNHSSGAAVVALSRGLVATPGTFISNFVLECPLYFQNFGGGGIDCGIPASLSGAFQDSSIGFSRMLVNDAGTLGSAANYSGYPYVDPTGASRPTSYSIPGTFNTIECTNAGGIPTSTASPYTGYNIATIGAGTRNSFGKVTGSTTSTGTCTIPAVGSTTTVTTSSALAANATGLILDTTGHGFFFIVTAGGGTTSVTLKCTEVFAGSIGNTVASSATVFVTQAGTAQPFNRIPVALLFAGALTAGNSATFYAYHPWVSGSTNVRWQSISGSAVTAIAVTSCVDNVGFNGNANEVTLTATALASVSANTVVLGILTVGIP